MHKAMKAPAMSCFAPWLAAPQSSRNHHRAWPESAMARGISVRERPRLCPISQTAVPAAMSMQAVCRVSVQTTVLMPPFWV